MIATELALLVWLVAIGLLVSVAYWPYGPLGLAFVSPIVGSALYALAGLVLFTVGRFSTIGSLALASVAAIVPFVSGAVRGALPSRRVLLTSTAYTAAWSLIVFVIAALGTFGRLSPDSIDYLTIAGGLERFGAIPEFTPDQILKRQFVTPVLQSGGVVTGRGYFLSLITLIGMSGFGLMLWLGARGLTTRSVRDQRIMLVVGVVGAFVLSTNRVLFHMFYINGHGVFASLLVLVVGLLWHATVTGRWSVAVLAGIAAAAIVPLRAEGIIVVAFFLLPVLVSASTPVSTRWTLVLPTVVTAVVWNAVALPGVLPAGSIGVTSSPAVAIAVALALVVVVASSQVPLFASLIRWAPLAGFGVLLLYTGARAVRGTTSLLTTLSATGANIGAEGLWAAFWWIAPLAIVACIVVVAVPHQNRLLWGLAAYPVLLLAFTYLRGSPYRVGPGDSANRMLMHVVFVIGLYLILAIGQIAAELEDDSWSLRSLFEDLKESLAVR
ncbi:MAG: hypothetical protein ABFR53_05880 [Actinomycetota bacterium]